VLLKKTMANKTKLRKILAGMSNKESGLDVAFKSVEKEMARVADKMREEAETKTVAMAKKRIAEIKKEIQSIFSTIDALKEELKKSESGLADTLNKRLDALRSAMVEQRSASLERLGMLSAEMEDLRGDIQDISKRKVEIPNFEKQIKDAENELKKLVSDLKVESSDKTEEILIETKETVGLLEEEIKKLRRDTMSAIGRGGNMNRNILVGNNPSTLGRYTDLNIKAGSNVTLSYSDNDNLKTTDLTIAATGGAGTNRNISTVNVSSVIAAVASTDYVIIAGDGIKLTLPTAVGNENLYTIKNKAASSVLVGADGSETIDGAGTALMKTQYTAIDLISDNANWHVT